MPEFVKMLAAVVLAVGSLILLVMMRLLLVAVCDVLLVAAFTAGVCFLRRHTLVVHNVPQAASVRAAAVLAPPRQAIAATPLARLAIEEKPCTPPSASSPSS